MEELKILLQKILNKDLQQIILSNSRNPEQIQKVKIRPVLIRDELLFQETRYKGHLPGAWRAVFCPAERQSGGAG